MRTMQVGDTVRRTRFWVSQQGIPDDDAKEIGEVTDVTRAHIIVTFPSSRQAYEMGANAVELLAPAMPAIAIVWRPKRRIRPCTNRSCSEVIA